MTERRTKRSSAAVEEPVAAEASEMDETATPASADVADVADAAHADGRSFADDSGSAGAGAASGYAPGDREGR